MLDSARVRDCNNHVPARQAGVLVAAALVGALFLLSQNWAVLLTAMTLLLAVAVLSKQRSSVGLALLGLSLYAIVGSGRFGLWPLSGLLAVVVAFIAAQVLGAQQSWWPWLRPGTWTRDVPWTVLAVIGLTAAALAAWQRLLDGRPPEEYLQAASGRSVGTILAAGLLFSLVNAAVEEAIFRGVMQEAVSAAYGVPIGIAVQAAAFGLLHLNGVPSGWLGVLMAGGWGLALGVLRWRTRGIAAPYVAHVAADLTIVLVLLPVLTT